MIVLRTTLISLLLNGIHTSSVEMGTCRMVCDGTQLVSSPPAFSVGRMGKKGPRGMKGENGVPGQRGSKGEPADPCICPDQNSLQQQIDELEEQIKRIHSPRDCSEVVNRKESDRGGVFTIYPYSSEIGVEVYCDTETEGGGWIVFQRRMDGSEDFFRGWSDYANGFGDLYGEFWLGLKKIHRLMGTGQFELRVDLADFENNTAYAKYSTFKVGGPESFFAITSTGYSGTAGDSLSLRNISFSTKDQDHDQNPGNCAQSYKGAMWYTSCHHANLNGPYLKGKHDSYANSVIWKTWKGYNYSLKFSEMKMRRKN